MEALYWPTGEEYGEEDRVKLRCGSSVYRGRAKKGINLRRRWVGIAGLLHESPVGVTRGLSLVDRLPDYRKPVIGNGRGLTNEHDYSGIHRYGGSGSLWAGGLGYRRVA